MKRLFTLLLILQVAEIYGKPVDNSDTASSGTGYVASGQEGSLLTPSVPNDMSSSSNRRSQDAATPVTNGIQSSGNEVDASATDTEQNSENDSTVIDGEREREVATGEATEYVSNDASAPYASGQALENIQASEDDLSSGQESEDATGPESGERAFYSYSEQPLDNPAQHASPPGTNAFEELQDTKRSPQIPSDSTVESIGYKRDVRLEDNMMAAPEYALLHPDQTDQGDLAEFEELTDSLSYDQS